MSNQMQPLQNSVQMAVMTLLCPHCYFLIYIKSKNIQCFSCTHLYSDHQWCRWCTLIGILVYSTNLRAWRPGPSLLIAGNFKATSSKHHTNEWRFMIAETYGSLQVLLFWQQSIKKPWNNFLWKTSRTRKSNEKWKGKVNSEDSFMTAVVIVKAAAQPTEMSTNISLQRKLRPARSIQQEIFRLEGFNMAIIENRPTCWRESMAKTTEFTCTSKDQACRWNWVKQSRV